MKRLCSRDLASFMGLLLRMRISAAIRRLEAVQAELIKRELM